MWSHILKDSVNRYIYKNGSRKKSEVSTNARSVNIVFGDDQLIERRETRRQED